jgi:hypothetical protein
MTQTVNARPGTVTAAQAIIWVLAVLGALGGVGLLVLGVVGLVGGASVAAGAAGTDASGFGAAFGGLIGFFAGGLIVVAVISLAFVGLWCWIASALGRASRPARIVLTVLCGIDLLWGVVALLGGIAEGDGAPLLGALVLLAIPATLMGLVWGSESSRRFFDGGSAYTPAPMSPPVGFARPQGPISPPAGMARPPFAPQRQPSHPGYGRPPFDPQSYPEGVTAPLRVTARCRTCQSELRPGWAHCGTCGAPVQPPRPVGA